MRKKILVVPLIFVIAFSTININQTFAAEPTLEIITEPLWDEIGDISEGLIRVFSHADESKEKAYTMGNPTHIDRSEVNDEAGFIDENGKLIIKIKQLHEYVEEYSKNLADPNYKGYSEMLKDGTVQTHGFNVEEIRDFHDGMAFVWLSQSYAVVNKPEDKIHVSAVTSPMIRGFIDKNNKLIIDIDDYDSYGGNSENENFRLNTQGQPPFDFKEGISAIWGREVPDNNDGFIGYTAVQFMDITGKQLGNPFRTGDGSIYMNTVFGDGLLGVGTAEKDEFTGEFKPTAMGYIDKNKNVVIDTNKFQAVHPFNDGLAFAGFIGNLGVIDKTGNYVIQPQFETFIANNPYDCKAFFEDRASVRKNGKWGIIDKKGNAISDFIWDRIAWFSDGLCAVSVDDKSGYVDLNGNLVIQPLYDDANSFASGAALVGNDGTYKLIDKKGNTIGTKTWSFENTIDMGSVDRPDLIRYQQNGKWGLARLTGEVNYTTIEKTISTSELDSITKKYSDISVYYENIESGYVYSYNAGKIYFAASVIKAPYVLYVYILAEKGQADLTAVHKYTSGDYWDGTGVIKNMKVGTTFTENELLKYAIRNSDNIAFRILIKKIYGISGFKEFVSGIGGDSSLIGSVAGANMTAEEAGLFAKEIYKYIESDAIYSGQFKTDLMSTTNPMIVSDFPIARKYGWAQKSFHDMAIVYSSSPYVLVIMTARESGTAKDFAVFKDVSMLFQNFNEMNFVK